MQQTTAASSPNLDRDHGYFASVSVTNQIEDVQKIFQDERNVEKVLTDLPEGITNFLNLRVESANADRIVLVNESKLADGTLTFLLKEDGLHGGTIITAEALLQKIHFREEGPSTLMNIFLKRMKSLIETGEIPTTKGQPSGREELKH